MVSMWWVLAAFVIGASAGIVLVSVMAMARMSDEDSVGKPDPARRIPPSMPVDASEW